METLNLSKRIDIAIDGDPDRVIRINPDDVHLRARLFELARTAAQKEKEVQQKAADIEAMTGEDENGLPKQAEASVALMIDYANFMMSKIDEVFGDGTSKKVFADGFDFDTAVKFLDFMMDKLGGASSKKIEERLNKKSTKKAMS